MVASTSLCNPGPNFRRVRPDHVTEHHRSAVPHSTTVEPIQAIKLGSNVGIISLYWNFGILRSYGWWLTFGKANTQVWVKPRELGLGS